jgi:hypothetical protein
MKNFSNFVKQFSKYFCSTPFNFLNPTPSPFTAETAALQGGAHYIDTQTPVKHFGENCSNFLFWRFFAAIGYCAP